MQVVFVSTLWQREIESGPLILDAIGPDAPAVALNDAADMRQTNPCALKLRRRMQAMEWLEQVVGILGVKADAVVSKTENMLPGVVNPGNLNLGALAQTCVLERI